MLYERKAFKREAFGAVLGITLVDLLLFTPAALYRKVLFWAFYALSWGRVVVFWLANAAEFLAHGKMAPDTRKGWTALLTSHLIWTVLCSVLALFVTQRQDLLNVSIESLMTLSYGMRLSIWRSVCFPCGSYTGPFSL